MAAAVGLGAAGVTGCGRPTATVGSSPAIDVATNSCANNWRAPAAGRATFTVDNTDNQPLTIRLVSATHDGVYGQLTAIASHQRQELTAILTAGSYQWQCFSFNGSESSSATRTVKGTTTLRPDVIYPLTSDESEAAVLIYQQEVTERLPALLRATKLLAAAVSSGNRRLAQQRWLTAHVEYEGLGGAYDAFGKYDTEINGSSHGLQRGIHDPAFTGFFKIEQLLWHNSSMRAVAPFSNRLVRDVTALQRAFPKLKFASSDLPIRAHEILEDALRDTLSDQTDYGSHSQLATLAANVTGTRLVVRAVSAALSARDPKLLRSTHQVLADLTATLDKLRRKDGAWPPLDSLPSIDRMRIDGAVDEALETLSQYPGVLQIGPDGD